MFKVRCGGIHTCHPNPWEWSQDDQEFKVSLNYIADFKTNLDYRRHCLKTKQFFLFPLTGKVWRSLLGKIPRQKETS